MEVFCEGLADAILTDFFLPVDNTGLFEFTLCVVDAVEEDRVLERAELKAFKPVLARGVASLDILDYKFEFCLMLTVIVQDRLLEIGWFLILHVFTRFSPLQICFGT